MLVGARTLLPARGARARAPRGHSPRYFSASGFRPAPVFWCCNRVLASAELGAQLRSHDAMGARSRRFRVSLRLMRDG